MKNFKLQNKIIAIMLLIISVILVLFIGSSTMIIYKSNLHTLNTNSYETLMAASTAVEKSLDMMKVNVKNAASLETIKSKISTKSEKLKVLTELRNEYNYDEIGFVNLDGQGYSNYGDFDFNDQIHFQDSKQGKVFVGEPIVNRLNGEVIVISSAPVYNNNNIIGTIFIVDTIKNINQMVSQIKFGKTGFAYILNAEGKTIYHKNIDEVANGFNVIEAAKNDKKYESMAEATKAIISGKQGIVEYKYNGVKMYSAYSPVNGYEAYFIVMTAPKNEFLSAVITSILINLILTLILLVISFIIVIKMAKFITKPIKNITTRLKMLSQGNLTDTIDIIDSKDELGTLSKSLYETINSLNSYVSDIKQSLGEMAQGNISVKLTSDFKGDFSSIKDSIYKISNSFNETLNEMNETAKRVSSGSLQVESASQSLAQGAAEQASSSEELSATINEISEHIKDTANNVVVAREKSKEESVILNEFGRQMSELINAMYEMNDSSKEIGKIIKVIEDIAFQTNIIALNAAVEAARAGTAGKGFAIVADEVRNLATKSAKAAKDTTMLIENSIGSIEKGAIIATNATESLNNVVLSEHNIMEMLENISALAVNQADAINHVNIGMEQISKVILTNSATAQESAATNQILSVQAQSLKQLLSRFKLEESYKLINDNTTLNNTNNLIYQQENYYNSQEKSKY